MTVAVASSLSLLEGGAGTPTNNFAVATGFEVAELTTGDFGGSLRN